MAAVTYSTVGITKSASFWSDATPVARLRAAVFRKDRFPRPTVFFRLYTGDFAEPFPPPLRELFCPRRSSLGRAPQRAARPLIPGRARPAPALSHLLWRLRASAFRATLLTKSRLPMQGITRCKKLSLQDKSTPASGDAGEIFSSLPRRCHLCFGLPGFGAGLAG